MGVRILHDPTTDSENTVLYCSTSGWAFGPVFDSVTDADSFLEFCDLVMHMDPRLIDATPGRLESVYGRWLDQQKNRVAS